MLSQSKMNVTSQATLASWWTAGRLARQARVCAQRMIGALERKQLGGLFGLWSRQAAGSAKVLSAAQSRASSAAAVEGLGLPVVISGECQKDAQRRELEGLLHRHDSKMRNIQEKIEALRWRDRSTDKHMNRMSKLRQTKQDLSARIAFRSCSMNRSSSEPPEGFTGSSPSDTPDTPRPLPDTPQPPQSDSQKAVRRVLSPKSSPRTQSQFQDSRVSTYSAPQNTPRPHSQSTSSAPKSSPRLHSQSPLRTSSAVPQSSPRLHSQSPLRTSSAVP